MSDSSVTRDGLEGVRPGREAPASYTGRRRRGGKRRGEKAMVPDAEFTSYYGKPVLNEPTWKAPDIAGYLFLGGLAGGSSLIAAAASATGQDELARSTKVTAAGAAGLSLVALVHDLGRPSRFLHMLRVFKVTSPMSVGSWLLAAYAPAAFAAAASSATGRLPLAGRVATVGAAALGPGVASYTAALISDTAVPAWHDGYREMPYVFVGSAAMAAGGAGMLTAPRHQHLLPRRAATLGAITELTAAQLMKRRIAMVAEPYEHGRSGRLMKIGEVLAGAGLAGSVLGRRSRVVTTLSGAALVASSAVTRFGIFEAGRASARDPKYTVVPQRERADQARAQQ
jgi:hypothetical protein